MRSTDYQAPELRSNISNIYVTKGSTFGICCQVFGTSSQYFGTRNHVFILTSSGFGAVFSAKAGSTLYRTVFASRNKSMNSFMPFIKFTAVALLGGSATLTAATLVLGLGAPLARAQTQAPTPVVLISDAQHNPS
ncbi:hypothetical protein N1037_17660 [Phaeobacter sp. G2]|jgi:hypothetical protein|nr:hypothetical protein N1037_17660 [Phaeobacter sp. G2]